MGWRIILGVLAFAIVGIANWLHGEHLLASQLALADEWNALKLSEAVLQSGPKPSDWPLRAFVPAAVLQSASKSLDGAEVDLPVGDARDGHVDGFIHFFVKSAQLIPGDARLDVTLATRVSYRPDRVDPWWSGAEAEVEVQAALVPSAQTVNGGVAITQFRVVPGSIALAAGMKNFDIRIIAGLGRALAADEVALRFREALMLAAPSLNPSFDIDASVNSTSFQPFGGSNSKDSGTTIAVTMKRSPVTLRAVLDQWLLTKSGLWVLGGNPVSAPAHEDAPLADQADARRKAIALKLDSFQRADSMVELTVPSKMLQNFVDAVLTPSPLILDVGTSGTRGNITDLIIIHNDKVLGNVGLEVRPRGDGFGHASIVVSPKASQWDAKSGIAIPLSVSARAGVALNVHLATGIGGGIGGDLDLNGDAAVPNLAIKALLERRTVAAGSAILLQPSIPCAPMTLDVRPGASPVAEDWIKVDPVGFQLEREIGGIKVAPVVLVDTLPLVTKLPKANDKSLENSSKAKVSFPRPFLVTTFVPDGVMMSDSGFTVRAAAQVVTRGGDQTEAEKNARNNLRQALNDATAEVSCKSLTGLKLVGGGTTIIDLYRELAYLGKSLKNHLEVTKDALKAATDLDPRNTPENLIKLADAIGTAVGDDAKHAWDIVTHPPAPAATIGNTTITATPMGPTISNGNTTISPVIPIPHPTIHIGPLKF
jgi:hypothetical protein